MHNRFSETIEDYLKAIYELTQEKQRASTNEIAERMFVTAASATGMIQRLATADPSLLDYQKYRGVMLTAEGRQIALEVIRHHRLLEAFLCEKLGYTWDEVHLEADRLEHYISEELEERISHALGDPAFDPHGDPIPTREFQLPEQSTVRLSELSQGNRATVVRIDNEDPDLLRYLAALGIQPHSTIQVLDTSCFDGNLHIQVSGQPAATVLGVQVTRDIFVKMK